ncbi:hypothetical protein GGR54DRAFT_636827 [Hypoxylon sp. NC1633]|nr:hypothetical protein GGR54DRAFT_636827 [Hypoxylon sp. NC1633]
MYFSKTTVVAFLAALLAALNLSSATPFLSLRQNGATCQTSDASLSTGDVTDSIYKFKRRGGNCPNTNGHASDCTTLLSHKSASIGVCGEEDDDDTQLSCEKNAEYVTEVQNTCLSVGRVGGMLTVDAAKRIIVF